MLRTVTVLRDPWDAHMLRSRLVAEEIPAFVVNDQHVWMDWPMSVALGGVRVMVPPSCLEDARAVWAGVLSDAYHAELLEMFGDIDDPKCPRCGATTIRCRPALMESVLGLALTVFGPVIKVAHTRCTCLACGKRWNKLDD